ncbi:MAG TPA: glycoside hydrolase family 32 protein [Bacilli bacterium]
MDLYRPIFHFMPQKNWMNDPNGLIYYKGEYHLFYQYNPYGDKWGTIHWGHAKSLDLVHWEHLPIALFPSGELGEEHCFSGCAVVKDGVPSIFYTSVGSGDRHQSIGAQQWMAASNDDMVTWEKFNGNPVLTLDAHNGLDIKEWRDPFVWKERETWYMVVGGSIEGRGCALIYSSPDLINWGFLNKLYEGSEEIWECPNLFKLEDKYVLIYSPSDVVKYYIGQLNSDFSFTPEAHGTIDYSGWEGFYAPNSLADDRGRRIMWGWMTENSRGEFFGGAGWAGVQSIPRILSLQEEGKLRIEPLPELQVLREAHQRFENVIISTPNWALGVKGRALEIIAEFELHDNKTKFGLKLLCSPDGTEETIVSFDPITGHFSVDRSKSSLSNQPHSSILIGKLDLTAGEVLRFHIFLDHSIIEVFANYKECISTRIYPTCSSSMNLNLFAEEGGSVGLKLLDVWKMKSIWN